jgi:hypothetical protein
VACSGIALAFISLELANFYAELSGVPDHHILDYWSFAVL